MSQITKPIALDETLQDVVTAIQGITQGGMIVATGTVGSSTQPVYINGGVPTAGFNFTKDASFIKHDSWSVAFTSSGWYTLLAGTSTQNNALIRMAFYGGGEYSEYLLQWSTYGKGSIVILGEKGAGTGLAKLRTAAPDSGFWSARALDIYLASNINTTVFIDMYWSITNYTKYTTATSAIYSTVCGEVELKTGDSIATTGNIRQAITTGTPTNINSKLTLGTYNILKSGNVVNFRIKLTVNTAFTPSESTELFTMPYSSPINNMYFQKQEGTDYGANLKQGSAEMQGAKVIYGSGPWNQLAVNTMILVSGTYLTND